MPRRLVGIDAVVDEALRMWGKEVGPFLEIRVGWSPDSIISRMVRQGVMGAAQTSAQAPSISDPSLAVDVAVRKIMKATTRQCLRLWYCSRDRENQDICSRHAGVSRRMFQYHLKTGREDVAELLGVRA